MLLAVNKASAWSWSSPDWEEEERVNQDEWGNYGFSCSCIPLWMHYANTIMHKTWSKHLPCPMQPQMQTLTFPRILDDWSPTRHAISCQVSSFRSDFTKMSSFRTVQCTKNWMQHVQFFSVTRPSVLKRVNALLEDWGPNRTFRSDDNWVPFWISIWWGYEMI